MDFYLGLKRSVLLVITLIIFSFTMVSAKTSVARRIESQFRLLPLEKITVGPYDNFDPFVSDGNRFLLFSRKIQLTPRVYYQKIGSEKTINLIDDRFDTRSPSISIGGDKMAFISYHRKSSGEVCFKKIDLEERSFDCIEAEESGDVQNPFWLNQQKLGYLTRYIYENRNELKIYDLHTKKIEIIKSGSIYSPRSDTAGQRIVYLEKMALKQQWGHSEANKIVVLNIKNRQERILTVNLPGQTGSPSFSYDGNSIYFSQYLNDTNFDQRIDGDDHSTIFRVDLRYSNNYLYPQQITSAENNCSQPVSSQDYLYMTCAFEGSLDIYRTLPSGVVPSHWSLKELEWAHESSRTYWERLLILNTMLYLKNTKKSQELISIYSSIMSNHYYANDFDSVYFYAQLLKNEVDPRKKNELELFLLLTQAKKDELISGSTKTAPQFKSKIKKHIKKLESLSSITPLYYIIKSYLQYYINNKFNSIKPIILNAEKKISQWKEIHWNLYFEILEKEFGAKKNTNILKQGYLFFIEKSHTSVQHQMYQTNSFLKMLMSVEPLPQHLKSIEGFIIKAKAKEVQFLLEAERLVLLILMEEEKSKKRIFYSQLDKLMSQVRNNYYLSRTLYVRAIVNFAKNNESLYMNLVTSSWLKYSNPDKSERAYARLQFQYTSDFEAYKYYNEKKYQYADDYFYSSMALTDDLESHYGYIRSMYMQNQQGLIGKKYDFLLKNNQIDENFSYVQSLLDLYESDEKEKSNVSLYLGLIKNLDNLKENLNHPMRYLLLGFSYLEIFLNTAKDSTTKMEYFEKAHQNLMLAYDLGRDNKRIKAAALNDLAILHQAMGHHSLAVKFFQLREPFGFINKEQELYFNWLYSRSLYYINNNEKAYTKLFDSVVSIEKENLDSSFIGNWRYLTQERLAFYALNAKKFKQSLEHYEQFFKLMEKPLTIRNDVRIHLAYGYVLFKLGDKERANKIFVKVLELSKRDRSSKRATLISLGILSQLESQERKLIFLQEKWKLLKDTEDELNMMRIKKEDWLEDQIKVLLNLSLLYHEQKQLDLSRKYLSLAIQLLFSSVKESEVYVSKKVFKTLQFYYNWQAVVGPVYSFSDSSEELKNIQSIYLFLERDYKKMRIKSAPIEKMWVDLNRVKSISL